MEQETPTSKLNKFLLQNRLFFIISIFVCVAVLATGFAVYKKTQLVITEETSKRMETLSNVLTQLVDQSFYSKTSNIQNISEVDYLKYKNKLDSFKTFYPEINHIFILIPAKKENSKNWVYLFSVAPSAYNEFKLGEPFKDISIKQLFGNTDFSHKKISKNNLIYNFLPITDNSGNIISIAGYSHKIGFLKDINKDIVSPIYFSLLFVFLGSILIFFTISKQIQIQTHKLVKKTKQIINGDYSKDTYYYSDKEMKKLSNELDSIAVILNEREGATERFEKIIKEDKAKFEFIIDSMSDGVFTVDKKMIITEFNKGAERITGFKREEAIGKSCRSIFHRDLCEGNCALVNTSKTGDENINIESNIITKDNRILPILSSSSPLKDEYGNIIGSVESFRDITEIKKMHESLETSKNQALAFSNILKDQNKELLDTYTKLEETQQKTHDYLKKLENTNYLLDKKNIELSKLNEFSSALSSILEIEELLHIVTRSCVEQMDAESGSLMLLDDSKRELVVRNAYGNYYYDIFNVHVKVGEGISGWVAQNGEALLVTNIEKDPRFKHIAKNRYESKSLISVPLKIKDKIIGVLNINHKKTKESFDKDDLDFLLSIVSQASVAIENANLYEKLQRSYFETVHALTMAVEAKDEWTRGHSDRVIKYAMEIAKSIGFSEWQLEKIRYAGALHDIGKIGISELIINKERFLTKDEYAIIKKHPVIGASIIEPIEFLHPIMPIIRHHHEHYDGNGYPDGLDGDNILYEARILSVADAYDAMTSDRPYRAALSVKKALNELKKHSGKQFDPKVVAIFEDIILREKNEKIISG